MDSVDHRRDSIGSISKSLERLPRWYKIGAFCGILIVIYLHDTFLINWLVMNLHNSLGTGWIWYPAYQAVLNQMSFKERLCFTLYGIALSLIVVALYKVFCQEGLKIGSSLGQLFPDRKGLTTLVCVLLCMVEMIRVREVITECFMEDDSISSIALKNLGKDELGSPKSRRNFHFVIQMELLKSFLLQVFPNHIMITLIAIIYRLFRDVRRNIHVALRWSMLTIASVSSIRIIFYKLIFHTELTLSALAALAWSMILLGVINFLYGPSKRAGMVATISTSYTITKTIRGLMMCMALCNIISLLALAILVSVHVVELIAIWIMVTLLILWIPAITDSCSLEGIIFVTSLLSILFYYIYQLSSTGALRLGIILASWWLNVSLLFNLVISIFHTRYAGIGIAGLLFLWAIGPEEKSTIFTRKAHQYSLFDINATHYDMFSPVKTRKPTSAAYSIISAILHKRIQWLCDVAEFRQPLKHQTIWVDYLLKSKDGSGTFYYIILVNVTLSGSLIALLTSLEIYQFPLLMSTLGQPCSTLITSNLFSRKLVRASVNTFCVCSFLFSWWALQYVLSDIIPIMPKLVSHTISGIFGCIILGVLMDMKDTMYEGILRVLGLMDAQEFTEQPSM